MKRTPGRCFSFFWSFWLARLPLAMLALAVSPAVASAQVPGDTTYQGVLTDAVGAPLAGPVDLVLRIYEVPSGGSPLYTETHTSVAIDEDNGSFLVRPGLGTTDLDTDGDGVPEANVFAFDSTLFANGPNRYLEVQVGYGVGGEILAPRQMIGAVPYALVAEDVVTDPATSNVGALIAAAQSAADAAQAAADAADANHTVDTFLSEAEVDAFVANNNYSTGAHTVDTNTQLSEAEVDAFVANNGFATGPHTVDTNTQLGEAEVDAFVSNNGFADSANVSSNTAEIVALQAEVASLQGATAGLELCPDGLSVADHDSGLLWERKTGTVGALVSCESASGGCPDPHDVNNLYEWANAGSTPNGNAFTDFLTKLNDSSQPATWSTDSSFSAGTQTGGCFADHCDWRLPNIVELQTIVDCSHGNPCIDPLFGPTASTNHWSASSQATNSSYAWAANLQSGIASGFYFKPNDQSVRAVRAGSCTH